MRKLALILCLVLAVLATAGCQFPGSKIKPDDKIGGMEFINEWET